MSFVRALPCGGIGGKHAILPIRNPKSAAPQSGGFLLHPRTLCYNPPRLERQMLRPQKRGSFFCRAVLETEAAGAHTTRRSVCA